MSQNSPSIGRSIIDFVLCYVTWLIFAALGVWLLLQTRSTIVHIASYLLEDPSTMRDDWIARSIDRWAIYLFGGVWVVAIFMLEGYLRDGLNKGQLLVRIGRSALILFVFAAIILGLQFI
ncbi:hypothetical protein KFU94_22885 [Chloroflexi bacterium TSY]|nr:hypothetical protein [Chloroflexi bacterium TSY]